MKKTLSTLSASAVTLLLSAPIVFAETDLNPCGPNNSGAGANSQAVQSKLCGLTSAGTGGLLRNIIIAVLVGAAVISLFFLIFGGIKWILSGGDKVKVGEARGTIVAALVGLIITFLAYFILNVVLGLFGLSFNNLVLPNLTGTP